MTPLILKCLSRTHTEYNHPQGAALKLTARLISQQGEEGNTTTQVRELKARLFGLHTDE